MPEQIIVSPGVFTQERDQSFLAQGVAEIGAAFVGPTTKGPAFIPTLVRGNEGFVTQFGEPDGKSYMGYTVKNYLQEAGSATIVRVLGLAGYTSSVATIYASGSGGYKVFAVLHPTISGSNITDVAVGGTTSSFSLMVSSSAGIHYSASGISPNATNTSFITNVFGSDSQTVSTTIPAYVYAVFPDAINQVGNYTEALHYSWSLDTLDLRTEYQNATTPWIKSQTIGGQKYELFKLHTINDGTGANKNIKVSINNIRPSNDENQPYGTFTIQVRDFNNTDAEFVVLESFTVNLNPRDANYIARRIGNSVPTYNSDTGFMSYEGDFPNLSSYIRVEMSTNVIPSNALPYGFAALKSVYPSTSGQVSNQAYVTSAWVNSGVPGYNANATRNSNLYYGFNFDGVYASGSKLSSLSYLAPTVGSNTVGSEFSLENLPSNEVAGATLSLTNSSHISYRKFSVPFQGGFDGFKPNREIAIGSSITSTNTQGFNLQNASASGSVEYKRALTQLSNADAIDFNLLVVPGVLYSQHTNVAQTAIDICEQRGDCFYILDLDVLDATIDSVTSNAQLLDTNYAAGYYPWVRVLDDISGNFIWAPPSVVLPEVYQYSDNVGAEWFAPAGLNRGGIPGAVGVKTRLSQTQRDTLYESKVNPIAQFPGQGICVWGQKTLQKRPSALDRVNVRRLLITVKKFIASSARYLVFEQNTEETRNRFLNIVNPYLAAIQQRSGLTAFRVVMDETNNTPDIIDQNILAGAIYLQPTRTAEFIKLDFNILPTGATFDTI